MMLLLTGCKKKAEQMPVPAPVYDDGITVSNNVPEVKPVIITGAGVYEVSGSKRAMIVNSEGDATFEVISAKKDRVVYSGKIRYKRNRNEEDDIVAVCDFTDLKKKGSYYIKTDTGTQSDVFHIKKGLYKELLSGRLDHFADQPARDDITEDNIGQCYMCITDRLLAQELFPDSVSPVVSDTVPKTLLIAKAQIDKLREYYDEDNMTRAFLHSDTGRQYQYAAVFAMFAYDYEEYDDAYAAECTQIAGVVYGIAEQNYEKGMYSATQTCDDKRFWASAQLYKLTGEEQYKQTAESYAGANPNGLQKGFEEGSSGYLGTVAYLTCYHKIDLDVAEILITNLMNDINTVVKQSREDDYLAAAPDKNNEEETVNKVFENARLVVLGNYISKSIAYVECGENQLSYLYGRNELGKDYAYADDSVYYNEPQEFILAGLIDSYIYEDREPEATAGKQNKKTGK